MLGKTSPELKRARWKILALLFTATTINYFDRSVIGILGPTLRDHVFGWSVRDYSYITSAFQLSYAIGLVTMGALIDRVGAKVGYAISISIWSVFNLLHAFIRPSFSLVGFIVARAGLGFGESGNFPSCAKAVTEWYPQDRRAGALGVINAGTNVGAILAPLMIPLLVSANGEGWQRSFLVTCWFSALWGLLWIYTYRSPQEVTGPTAAPQNEARLPWSAVFRTRETWAFAIMKTTDAVWWFYLFWGAMFLSDRFHLDIGGLGLPMIAIFVLADIGSVVGGWISGFLIRSGVSVNRARKFTLLACAVCVIPVTLATRTNSAWLAIGCMALAAAAHQAWSVNIFTIVSDVFPKRAVSSVIGIGGMVGSLSSMTAFLLLGHVLSGHDSSAYFVPFAIASVWYLIALGLGHVLSPKLEPAKIRTAR